jgi:hypothetical protein
LEVITLPCTTEYHYVFVACDHEKTAIWSETHTTHWVLRAVQIKELKALKLEVCAIIIIDLEDFKYTLVVTHRKVFAIR